VLSAQSQGSSCAACLVVRQLIQQQHHCELLTLRISTFFAWHPAGACIIAHLHTAVYLDSALDSNPVSPEEVHSPLDKKNLS
jgi:hypothetical protein